MKKFSILILSFYIISSAALGQHAFISEFQFGSFDNIDLNSALKTNIGSGVAHFSASDFGPGGVLYAINDWDNGFYTIDTIDGATTLLGTNPPPEDHVWTGMAYDEETGIMYGISYHDVTQDFYSSLYSLDVTDGSYTLIGSQTIAPAITSIGIDGLGDMYAMQLGNPCKLYKLNKATGAVNGYPGIIGHWASGQRHGMDWCPQTEAMYITTDVEFGNSNTLRTIDLTNANTTVVGDLGAANWTATIAVVPILSADFTVSTTDLCIGGTVDFTDESMWAISWSWTFEGGTPATSTDQNPVVTYNTPGIYDVTLEVSNGATTNTLYIEDMITVRDIPVQPDTPEGPTEACGYGDYIYTTTDVLWAETYLWEVLPVDAGTITGSGISADFEASEDWTGAYTIKVMASNACGGSIWSSELNCSLAFGPAPFFVEEGGSYCEGDPGVEVILDGSELNVDYELFLEGVTTGIILAGTGNPLNFGYQTDEGLYSVTGFTSECSTLMISEAWIYPIYPPTAASLPTGPVEVCSGTITDYQTGSIPDATELVWNLSPSGAGVINGSGENITTEWSLDYNGLAYLSVFGTNDCGPGPTSDELEINVSLTPQPEISGETLVCNDHEYIYSTDENPGSTYNWEVVGGNIVSGSGTSEISIVWTTIGAATLFVTETINDLCEGTSDTLDITVDDCTAIEMLNNDRFGVYPNPAKNQITISINSNKAKRYDLNIYNQHGQRVYEVELHHNGGNGKHQINVASYPIGLYFVRIATSAKEVFQSKFEVVK